MPSKVIGTAILLAVTLTISCNEIKTIDKTADNSRLASSAKTASNLSAQQGKSESPSKLVKLVYIVPTDAAHSDRQDLITEAVKTNVELWASYGATWKPTSIETLRVPHDTQWFRTNHSSKPEATSLLVLRNSQKVMQETFEDYQPRHPNFKYLVFTEVNREGDGGYAAVTSDHVALFPKEVIDEIQNGNQEAIGMIGHELGHTFGINNEDCDNQVAPKGIMCNGTANGAIGFPNVELNDYHFKSLFNEDQKCFFAEHNC